MIIFPQKSDSPIHLTDASGWRNHFYLEQTLKWKQKHVSGHLEILSWRGWHVRQVFLLCWFLPGQAEDCTHPRKHSQRERARKPTHAALRRAWGRGQLEPDPRPHVASFPSAIQWSVVTDSLGHVMAVTLGLRSTHDTQVKESLQEM